jgi:hypothetical protein
MYFWRCTLAEMSAASPWLPNDFEQEALRLFYTGIFYSFGVDKNAVGRSKICTFLDYVGIVTKHRNNTIWSHVVQGIKKGKILAIVASIFDNDICVKFAKINNQSKFYIS